NHRGCGEGMGHARLPYHSGRGEDVSETIESLRKKFPSHKILAVGFSLGANALLLLLSGVRGKVLPDAALAVNAPINLLAAAQLLRRGWNHIYDLHFSLAFRREFRQRQRFPQLKQNIKIPLGSSVYEIDRLYTAPLSGFTSREEYYRTCSSAPA